MSSFFQTVSQLGSKVKGWRADWPVNQELCSPAQLPSGIAVHAGTDLIVLQQTPRKRHPGQPSRFVFWMIETENGLTGSWIPVVTWSRLLILSFYLLFIPFLRVCHGWKQLMCDELLRSRWVWLIIRAAAGASVVSATEEAKGPSITLDSTLSASLHHHLLPLP